MSSRLIRMVAYGRISFFFKSTVYIEHFLLIHSFINGWPIGIRKDAQHLPPAGMVIVKKTQDVCWRGCRELEPYWRGCKMGQPLWKAAWSFLKIWETDLPCDPAVPSLSVYPKGWKSGSQRDISTAMSLAALFTTAKMERCGRGINPWVVVLSASGRWPSWSSSWLTWPFPCFAGKGWAPTGMRTSASQLDSPMPAGPCLKQCLLLTAQNDSVRTAFSCKADA